MPRATVIANAPAPIAASNGTAATKSAPLTKGAAIREAFSILGPEATYKEVQGFVEQKFNLQVGKEYVSEHRTKLRGKKKPGRKPMAKKKGAKTVIAKPIMAKAMTPSATKKIEPMRTPTTSTSTIVANTVTALNGMAAKLGWDEVASLVSVLRSR